MRTVAESPYTQFLESQLRGPMDSTGYNQRVENNFKDLVVLYNKDRVLNADIKDGYSRFAKELLSLAVFITDLESRVAVLETNAKKLTFYSTSQIDNDRFTGTPFAVDSTLQNYADNQHGVITLPVVISSSVSKLYFTNVDGVTSLPGTLGTKVVGVNSTADSTDALIDTSEPELAIVKTPGRLWERNVITSSPVAGGAEMFLYIKCPIDLFTNASSNTIIFHPYPALDVDILEIAYTSKTSVLMDDSDGYIPINSAGIYSNNAAAIGWVPPGGWNGDTDTDAGPRAYYFPPVTITGLRIHLRQQTYYMEGGQAIYSYGASKLDLLYTKFLSSGRTIVRFDLPNGQVLNVVDSVQPAIYNLPPASVPNVFSWRAIYETSFNSGIYTTDPVPNSTRVWIDVTLNTGANNVSPALTNLTINYS